MEKVAGKNAKGRKIFLVLLISVVLVLCVSIGSVLAWLTYATHRETPSDNLSIGFVDFEIYSGNIRLTTAKHSYNEVTRSEASAFEIPASGSTIRNIDLSIRNTGSINAIIRVTLQIYTIDKDGNRVAQILDTSASTPNKPNFVSITNTGWVNDFKDNVLAGYTYYNKQITPYTISRNVVNTDGTSSVVSQNIESAKVPVLTQILTPADMVNSSYYISIIVEGVAWAGNMYQENVERKGGQNYWVPKSESGEDEDSYPFGFPDSLPIDWTAWQRTTNEFYIGN